ERVCDLVDELRVETLAHDGAVVRDVIGVTEDAHDVLDVWVLGLDGLAAVRAWAATEGDGNVDVTVVDGEGGRVVRAGEDGGHLRVRVDAVRVLEGDVRELVTGSGARIDEGDGLAAELLEGRDAAVATHVELRAVRGGALAHGGQDDLGAVVVDGRN